MSNPILDEFDAATRRAIPAQRERRYADARSDWKQAVELARRLDDRARLAAALRSLGEIERKLHDGVAARAHYEEAVNLYRGSSEPLTLAHTVRHLGDVYHELRLPGLAEPCYEEALALYETHPEAEALDVANAVRSMAVLKSERGELAEARKLWTKAKELYAAVDVQDGVGESLARLAQLDPQAGD